MEVLIALLAGTMLVAVPGTLRSVHRDGRGRTPEVRSARPWNAGSLPSEPYAAPHAWYLPGAWMR